MKRLTSVAAIVLGGASVAWPASPGALTTLHAVAALSNDQAGQRLPVAFEATITYYARTLKNLDVEDDGVGIYVKLTRDFPVLPGDRVLVQGTTQPSFLPYVLASGITVLQHGTLPKPLAASFDDIVGTKINCRLIKVRGVIRAADLVTSAVAPTGRLQLLMDGGYVDLEVESQDENALKSLLDAEVEVTGVAGRKFDGKMQQIGAKLKVSSLSDIRVMRRAGVSPWSLPVTPLGEIVTGTHVRDFTARLRVHGTITYYQPGKSVVLQSGRRSLWISTQTIEPLQIGDVADATGFPEIRDGLLSLNHAEVQDSHLQAPITPQPATWRQLAFWGRSVLGGHQDDLVSIEGRVLTEVREAAQDEYILAAEGRLFTAVYRHPPEPRPLPAMLQVPLGSTIRVTGICVALEPDPFNDEAPFDILLRSFDDIGVIAEPSWLSIRNLVILLSVMLLLVIASVAWGATLNRKVRRQTAALSTRIEAEAVLERRMAQLEQRRSRILEDINGSRPLDEILEEITELVSFWLEGAPCRCELADGERLGIFPPEPQTLRVVRVEIPGRAGAALGTISAAFDPRRRPASHENEALSLGARLAALAIETRRLYVDLRYRSEFDLLTDIHNRFSLDKHLDNLIEFAHRTDGTFGLIYIDLDRFKQVNDLHGHHIGDLYLQQVARRMKRQLRGNDLVARLGGDEFAALVLEVRDRADVEEVARRLERCFDRPFAIDGIVLSGSASMGVAMYPEDGATKDSLLNAADAGMYAAKHCRHQTGEGVRA